MNKKIILLDPNRTFAGKPIGNYNPNNDAFNKRKPNPDPLPDLKGKIDWSKLDLSKVFTMATKENGLTMWDAIERANKEGYIIIPNQVHDRMLVETDFFKTPGIKEGYPAWTGTLVIYTNPDTPFNDNVIYNWEHDNVFYSISINIPEIYKGKVNSALVIEHPNFNILSLGNNSYEIKLNKNIFLFENFPRKSGQYRQDKQFRILIVEKSETEDKNIIVLQRIESNYIGTLVRSSLGIAGRNVYAIDKPSDFFGVHVIKKEDIPFSD